MKVFSQKAMSGEVVYRSHWLVLCHSYQCLHSLKSVVYKSMYMITSEIYSVTNIGVFHVLKAFLQLPWKFKSAIYCYVSIYPRLLFSLLILRRWSSGNLYNMYHIIHLLRFDHQDWFDGNKIGLLSNPIPFPEITSLFSPVQFSKVHCVYWNTYKNLYLPYVISYGEWFSSFRLSSAISLSLCRYLQLCVYHKWCVLSAS